MKRKMMIFAIFLFCSVTAICQQTNWTEINDNESGVKFSFPKNATRVDSLSTILYASLLDSTEAVQVHIFKEAYIDGSDPVFNKALAQENNDTLRAFARTILLITKSELTAIKEIHTNGVRGMEIGIRYRSLEKERPYYTFMRYYLSNGNFISFAWTGEETALKNSNATRDRFFNSTSLQ